MGTPESAAGYGFREGDVVIGWENKVQSWAIWERFGYFELSQNWSCWFESEVPILTSELIRSTNIAHEQKTMDRLEITVLNEAYTVH